MSEELVIAIDGPGGVGKSTASRLVAEHLGLSHLDTGAFYRAATVAVLEAGADPALEPEVVSVVSGRRIDHRDSRTYLNGRDVSVDIRSDAVNEAVSAVSAHPRLRARMVEAQQRWVHGRGRRAVVEGRDIGTVVFPQAQVKVFLDADPEVRAARRLGESQGSADTITRALHRRDRLDSSRAASPLRPAEDATIIDTTNLTIDQVVDRILDLANRA